MASAPSDSRFSKRQRQHQIDDDLTAGYRIPAVLTAIVLFGLFSMIFSVWLAI